MFKLLNKFWVWQTRQSNKNPWKESFTWKNPSHTLHNTKHTLLHIATKWWDGDFSSQLTLSFIIPKTLKLASKHTQISWLFPSEKKKKGFSQWFWALVGGGVEHPPPRHLTYIFNPAANRVSNVKMTLTLCILASAR